MKAIDFYEFIMVNDVEYHLITDNEIENDIIIILYFLQIDKFIELLKDYEFNETPIKCTLHNDYLNIWMLDILLKYDINISDLFKMLNNE